MIIAGPDRRVLRALDLFCGGGGAALGLLAAGFDEVVGIDIVAKHEKVYPGDFILGDATTPPVNIESFDFVWASPPCQAFTSNGSGEENTHPNLIPQTRAILDGHPFTCIENVPSAPIRKDIMLMGPMVGLPRIRRRRWFELSFLMFQPPVIDVEHDLFSSGRGVSITTSMCSSSHFYSRKAIGLRGRVSNSEAREVMGIKTAMTNAQIGEAVAPPMAEFIGREAITQMLNQRTETL